MTVYEISYDLQEPGQDYVDIHEAIESLGPTFDALESTWLVDVSNEGAGDIADDLTGVTDTNDSIVVTQIPKSGGGRWAYRNVSGGLGNWFDEHL